MIIGVVVVVSFTMAWLLYPVMGGASVSVAAVVARLAAYGCAWVLGYRDDRRDQQRFRERCARVAALGDECLNAWRREEVNRTDDER